MAVPTFTPKSKPPRPATARRFYDSFAAAKGTTGNVYRLPAKLDVILITRGAK